jgi:hypothetical protein
MKTRNELIAAIVLALGGTISNPKNSNALLKDWLNSLGG